MLLCNEVIRTFFFVFFAHVLEELLVEVVAMCNNACALLAGFALFDCCFLMVVMTEIRVGWRDLEDVVFVKVEIACFFFFERIGRFICFYVLNKDGRELKCFFL